ncbi:MAG: hypothetical protein ACR2RE_26550 [Geminicoccaceae bacterium]
MSSKQGDCVIEWIEHGGQRFLKGAQQDIYQILLLHVGATDMLRQYAGTEAYWQNVQTILDCFFSAAERAEMCAQLIEEPLFLGDPAFKHFLHQARAELRCCELAAMVKKTSDIHASIRSIG